MAIWVCRAGKKSIYVEEFLKQEKIFCTWDGFDYDLNMYDSKEQLYDSLFENKEEIESKLGLQLDWQRLDDKKASRILYRIPGLNFDDHSNYDALMN